MMIVLPMIFQNLTFGYIIKHFLNNDPRQAITFAGCSLLIAALITMTIKNKKANPDTQIISSGH